MLAMLIPYISQKALTIQTSISFFNILWTFMRGYKLNKVVDMSHENKGGEYEPWTKYNG